MFANVCCPPGLSDEMTRPLAPLDSRSQRLAPGS
jgi:hypothetical protein